MPKGKQATNEAAAAFDAKLAAAMEEARSAGLSAVREFIQSGNHMVKDGIIYDASGWASLDVLTPSYHVREALKRLNPKAHGFRGSWDVLSFGRDMPAGTNQSITAYEIACKAALKVMANHFPGENFTVDSRMD